MTTPKAWRNLSDVFIGNLGNLRQMVRVVTVRMHVPVDQGIGKGGKAGVGDVCTHMRACVCACIRVLS